MDTLGTHPGYKWVINPVAKPIFFMPRFVKRARADVMNLQCLCFAKDDGTNDMNIHLSHLPWLDGWKTKKNLPFWGWCNLTGAIAVSFKEVYLLEV